MIKKVVHNVLIKTENPKYAAPAVKGLIGLLKTHNNTKNVLRGSPEGTAVYPQNESIIITTQMR